MVNIDIVNYLKEGTRRGFSISLLRQKLLEGGFDEFSVNEAIDFLKAQKVAQPPAEIIMNIKKEKQESEFRFFRKIKCAIADPSQLFIKTRSENVWDALKYNLGLCIFPFIIVFLASIALFSFFMYLFGSILNILQLSLGGTTPFSIINILFIFVVAFFAFFILIPMGNFVGSFIIHGFTKAYGGRERYAETYKAVIYASTPSVLLSFIPFVNVAVPIWSLVLGTIGLSINQNISKGRAFLSLITLPMMFVVAFLTYTILDFFF